MAAQQPAAQTGRLRGEAPDIFHGASGKKHFTNYRYIALVAERSLIDKYPLLYPQ
jgi:hypothetical protein